MVILVKRAIWICAFSPLFISLISIMCKLVSYNFFVHLYFLLIFFNTASSDAILASMRFSPLAIPFPAISKAVPCLTEVLIIGNTTSIFIATFPSVFLFNLVYLFCEEDFYLYCKYLYISHTCYYIY